MMTALRFALGFVPWALCLAATAPPAFATVVLPVDFATMAREAQVIVHGHVVDVRSQMPAGRRTIETLVTVAVTDSLKGSPGRTITFSTPGGQVGRYRRVMVGVPEFEQGDEVVLFLHARPPMVPTLFGLSQGVYRVARSDSTTLVTPAPVIAREAGAERVVRGDPARRPLPIDVFAREVRAAVERGR